jgi:hypothetical protein
VFVVAGLPGLVIALLVLFVAEPRARQDEGVLRTDSSLLSAVHHVRIHFRTLGLYILGATVVTVLAYGVLAWMPTVLVRVHAQSQQQVGLALGVANLVLGPAGVLLSAWLLDTARRNKKAAAPATLRRACHMGLSRRHYPVLRRPVCADRSSHYTFSFPILLG